MSFDIFLRNVLQIPAFLIIPTRTTADCFLSVDLAFLSCDNAKPEDYLTLFWGNVLTQTEQDASPLNAETKFMN